MLSLTLLPSIYVSRSKKYVLRNNGNILNTLYEILTTKMKGGEMMNNHPKLTRSLATVATIAMLFGTAAPAFAQTTNSSQHQGFFQGLIQFIEQRFGLDKTQMQSAVQQYQSQRSATITPRPTQTQQQMEDREKSRLDKLVSSGKITSAQETAILSELSSEQSKYNLSSLQSETPQQRKSTMQSMQSDLKSWAQANNINPMYVMPFGGMRRGHGMMHGAHGHWSHPSGAPTPTPGS